MKNCNLLSFLLAFAALLPVNTLVSQTDFSKVDEQARSITFPEKQNIARLAGELTKNLKTEKEKARAIYVWIADRIRYDIKTATDEDAEAQEVVEKQQPAVVLKSKKAVCEGYANLFGALCKAAGLQSIRVEGFSKNPRGKISRIGHVWNIVRTEGEWGLVDVTWGAGSVDVDDMKFTEQFNEKYFLTKPEVFILNHYPNDPMFQLLEQPIDFQKFKTGMGAQTVARKTPGSTFPNSKDSLNRFVALDSVGRLLDSWSRVLRFDPQNGYANYHLALYHYNRAVERFNRYQTEMGELAQKKVKLTQAILRDEAKAIGEVEAELGKSNSLLMQIQAGDKSYRMANLLRREVESKQRILSQAKRQNEALKAKVKD